MALLLLAAHLVELALWAAIFVLCNEFADFPAALHHSAVNYTTLGYGDLLMSPASRRLGPMEAAVVMLLFGLSTAICLSVIQKLAQTRLHASDWWNDNQPVGFPAPLAARADKPQPVAELTPRSGNVAETNRIAAYSNKYVP